MQPDGTIWVSNPKVQAFLHLPANRRFPANRIWRNRPPLGEHGLLQQSCLFRQPLDQIHVLQRLPAGALHKNINP